MTRRQSRDRWHDSLGYMFREAFRRLWLSRRNTFIATAMIAVALTILGAFLLVSENLSRAIDQQTGSTRMTIYLTAGTTSDEIEPLTSILRTHPETSRFEVISPELAIDKFGESFPALRDLAGDLEQNPFPWSIEVPVSETWIDSREFNELVTALRRVEGVEEIQMNWEWVERLRSIVRTIRFTGLAIGGALAIAAAFMISNVIRLTMVLYSEEIGIMRLVGATEGMIRFPFLLEGFIQGLLGGCAAAGILALLYHRGVAWLDPEGALIASSLFTTFLPVEQIVWLIAGGPLSGLLGSWLAVRRTSRDRLGTGE